MDFNIFETLMFIIGGLGIFLYGINLMGDSLKEIAGDRLKVIIEKTTNTPVKGILVGALVTAIIQSSSGTTALTVVLSLDKSQRSITDNVALSSVYFVGSNLSISA